MSRHIKAFEESKNTSLLYELKEITIPHISTQPLLVPEIREEYLRGNIPSSNNEGLRLNIKPEEVLYEKNIALNDKKLILSSCIISPELNEHTLDTYDLDMPIGSIPIYLLIVVNKSHASLIVYFSGKLFSLGLLYDNISSILSSPDTIIKPESSRFKYDIIDIGILKKKHLMRILDITGKTQLPIVSEFTHSLKAGHYVFSNYIIPLNKAYSKYTTKYSSRKNQGFNCASFIEFIFRERIHCGDRYTGVFIDPSACKSRYIDNVPLFFRKYMKRYIDEDTLDKDLFNSLINEYEESRLSSIISNSMNCLGEQCSKLFINKRGTKRKLNTKINNRYTKKGKGRKKAFNFQVALSI